MSEQEQTAGFRKFFTLELIVSLAIQLVVIGISYGILTTRVSDNEKEMVDMKGSMVAVQSQISNLSATTSVLNNSLAQIQGSQNEQSKTIESVRGDLRNIGENVAVLLDRTTPKHGP